jgi:hypothetical protein
MVTILLPYEESVYWVLLKVPKVQDHIVAQLVDRFVCGELSGYNTEILIVYYGG